MENHGTPFQDRWKVTRERVLAMRECWTTEEPEFHGEFVDFDPVWSYPKPITPSGPPVLLGAGSKWTWDRVAEYCDGWIPLDGFNNVEDGREELRAACEKRGRDFDELRIEPLGGPDEARLTKLMELDVDRVFIGLPSQAPAEQETILDDYAKLVERLTS
jgi:alkanesulfonate monooxygenase SsuD/methylene tetrahydromethanopterin reductase-like flavin-dependent oxidoreductase (luciferase family)